MRPGVSPDDPWPNLVPMLQAHLRRRESVYQIRHFQLYGNGLTPWGTYLQALRELSSGRQNLQEIHWLAAEEEVRRDEARDSLADDRPETRITCPYKRRLLRIQVERSQHVLERLNRQAAEGRRIMSEQYAVAEAMLAELGGAESLTPRRIEQLDAEFFAAKARRAIASEHVAGRLGVTKGVVEMAWNLDPESRDRLLADVKSDRANLVTTEERRWLPRWNEAEDGGAEAPSPVAAVAANLRRALSGSCDGAERTDRASRGESLWRSNGVAGNHAEAPRATARCP